MPQLYPARLTAYSIFSTAFLATVQSDAQIIYTDIDPDNSIHFGGLWAGEDSTVFTIDLNHDNIFDATFYLYSSVSKNLLSSSVGVYLSLSLPTGNSVIYQYKSEFSYGVARLGEGVKIGPEALWEGDFEVMFSHGWSRSNLAIENYSYGEWRKGEDEFVGIKFKIDGRNHYGWIRLTIEKGSGRKPFGDIIIKDYAYNPNPDEPILTPIHLQAATGLKIENLKNNTSAHNFYLQFSSPEKLNGIEEYRIYVVPEYSTQDVNIISVVNNANYASFIPKEDEHSVSLVTVSNDFNGETIHEGVNYIAYVLSFNKALQFNDLALSLPSDEIQLKFTEPSGSDPSDELNVVVNGDQLSVELAGDQFIGGNISIYDAEGKRIFTQTLTSTNTLLEISPAKGIYFVTAEKDGIMINKKILIAG